LKCKVNDLVLIIQCHGSVAIGRVRWADSKVVLAQVDGWPMPHVVWHEDVLAVGHEEELLDLRNAITQELKKREAAWITAKKVCNGLKDELDCPEIKKLVRQFRRQGSDKEICQ